MNLRINENQVAGIEYLTFRSFDVDLGSYNIIWAPNGVGKTSIYRHLKESFDENISYVDCEDYKNDIVKEKKEISIGANIASLDRARNDLESIKKQFDIEGSLKTYNLNTITALKKAIPDKEGCKKNPIDTILNFSSAGTTKILSMISEEDVAYLIGNIEPIRVSSSLTSEIDEIKNETIREAMVNLDAVLSSDDSTCPVCGSHVDKVKEVIADRREQLKVKKAPLIASYRAIHQNLSVEEAIEKVDCLIADFGNKTKVSDAQILDLILSKGSKEKAKELSRLSDEVRKIKEEIATLEKKRDSFYESLATREEEIRNFFFTHYGLDSQRIDFDASKGAVIIHLFRPAETYSTGEINLMALMVGINAYIANDANALIIDDPISSFDIANQYTVVFELVKLAKDETRPVTILTHNMNCINIADSQRKGAFKYWYLEKAESGLSLMNVKMPTVAEGRMLSPESIIAAAAQSENQEIKERTKYLQAIMKRTGREDVSKVFHYDECHACEYDGATLSNTYLVELIDEKSTEDSDTSSFVDRCINKMLIFIALRVWLEFNLLDGASEQDKKKLQGCQLGEKIDILFPRGKEATGWLGSPKITRSFLYSKKTMMNQQAHPSAQSMPFEYALNLCQEDIDKEIADLKTKFVLCD